MQFPGFVREIYNFIIGGTSNEKIQRNYMSANGDFITVGADAGFCGRAG